MNVQQIIGDYSKITSLQKIRRTIKFFLQRLIRGWDDSETWNLDFTFAKYILPRLIEFKKLSNGIPYPYSKEEWGIVLDKMIFSFQYIVAERETTKENHETIQEGIDLFAKNFQSLWW